MPLLHRRAFSRQRPPGDLRPDEEVFLCKITHEVFRSYDEFFERTILCNSLVWSCALTGRAGLTYLEALESERRARLSLQSFSPALLVPLLHLAALSCRGRLTELCEDVYGYAKDRFFPGETVDVNAARHVCEILQVHSSHSSANGRPKAADHDTIVISDSDEEAKAFQSPSAQVNGKKKKPLSPSVFKYTVRMVNAEHTEAFTVKANQISRRKTSVSRERLKLLFKQHCEPQRGTIMLKPSTVVKYRLSEQTFSQFFPDEPPLFPSSAPSKGAGRGSPAQQKEDMAAQDRLKKKEDVQKTRRRDREEQRKRFEEDKRKRREEKDKEREKLKEEKKRYAERLKLWNQPREDMDCEDLKELPSPVPVRTRLPAHLFGDALMVLEFLRAFGETFALKDEFPDGVSLEVLEEALVGSDPEGPLCELLFFFLSAIFQALDEEQEDLAKEQAEGLSEVLDEDFASSQPALSTVSSLAASWSPLHQGCGLKQLDLDSCSLSEILRLHILSSGADCCHGNAKFRYQKQGGFTPMDDPCAELRLAEPALLRRLTSTAVYDLSPGEKLRILQALVGKLLTLSSSRDLMEDCVEDQKSARQELREIRAEAHRRDREEAALRVRLRKEEKLREQELRLKKEARLREQELKGGLHRAPPLLSAEEQEKVRELQERIQRAAACTCLLPLGRDRLYRRYWLLPSAATLLVEDDCFGLTEDMLRPRPAQGEEEQQEELQKELQKELQEPTERRWVTWVRFGLGAQVFTRVSNYNTSSCSAGSSPAPLHTCGPPVNRLNQWFCYTSEEQVEQLIEALNPRGLRESSLKEALLQERDRLAHLSRPRYTGDGQTGVALCAAGKRRPADERTSGPHGGGLTCPAESQRQDLKSDSTASSGSPQPISSSVRTLAQALAHIEQGIERRFIKAPLGDEDSKKDQKNKKNKKKDEDQASDVCLSLERSVLWSRSVLNARCRICRRKGDADNMLLCDGCDRGHHTHCLRPRLKKNQAPPPKGQQATPKGQQATAKNSMPASAGKNTSASKSSGKKATPPTVKANKSAGKAPTRSGSRVSARLSHEILSPNGRTTKPSPGRTEPCKRQQTDVAPPLKPSRPVLAPSSSSPSSSSSRRSSGRNYGVHELSACEQLTVELVRHEDSWPFKKLVSRTQVPDYYDIIKKPIALSIIREKVNNCEYQTADGFVSDVDLMFSNCLQYNPRHTSEAKAGRRLQLFFHSALDRLGLSERSAPPAKVSRH
ncbi:Bromodomain adjacent to zinc finger domain protein 1A [Liparis tanakae]|uniref:Bromodomain adjacent to zinc finger domain protein 1A n=1 Tax=Liparis tanakae TaxID=230148 RepID=A0A4Z2JAY6_9TELE|nr:Bromodomain adjacent to zinc finger domain protein 1A [Liparis tanakae]